MRHQINTMIMIVLVMLLGIMMGCGRQADITLKFHENGSVEYTARTVMNRAQIEQMLQFQNMRHDGMDEDEDWDEGSEPVQAQVDESEQAAQETDPDAKLEADIRKMILENPQFSRGNEGIDQTLNHVKVGEKEVDISATLKFDSLEQFVQNMHLAQMPFRSIRIEGTPEGQLRVRFSPANGVVNPAMVRQQMQAMQVRGSLTVIMPGKVIASDLPNSQENTTSLTFAADDSASLDQLIELVGKDIEIVAEPNGLTLPQEPLETNRQAVVYGNREMESNQLGADIPITDAQTGFRARGTTVQLNTTHYFPQGAEYLGDMESMRFISYSPFMIPINTCRVQATLFAPPGRLIISAGSVNVLEAVDDQDRPVTQKSHQDDVTYRGGDQANGSAEHELTLDLSLPETDAQAIERLKGQIVVTTSGQWKQHVIEPVKPAPDKIIDLSDLLPGAQAILRRTRSPKVNAEMNQSREGVVQIQFRGPETVAHIRIEIDIPGMDNTHGYARSSTLSKKDGQTVRDVTYEYTIWSPGRIQSVNKPRLILSYPDGLKRERVTFTLEALDLF